MVKWIFAHMSRHRTSPTSPAPGLEHQLAHARELPRIACVRRNWLFIWEKTARGVDDLAFGHIQGYVSVSGCILWDTFREIHLNCRCNDGLQQCSCLCSTWCSCILHMPIVNLPSNTSFFQWAAVNAPPGLCLMAPNFFACKTRWGPQMSSEAAAWIGVLQACQGKYTHESYNAVPASREWPMGTPCP